MHSHSRGIVPASSFATLGAHVGVRALVIAPLAHDLRLRPEEVGLANAVGAAAGIVSLIFGAAIVDRVGAKRVLLAGLVGTAATFVLLAMTPSFFWLIVVQILYGLIVSGIDLGANTVASDAEAAAGRSLMPGFHALFSVGGAVGALFAVVMSISFAGGFRIALVATGIVMVAIAGWLARKRFPVRPTVAHEPDGTARKAATGVGLLAAAIAVVGLCFFGDGILESFGALFIAPDAGSSLVAAGVAIAGFHLAGAVGRSLSHVVLQRLSERIVLPVTALGASACLLGAALQTDAAARAALFIAAGMLISPIVPLGISLAARAMPASPGRAVGIVTSVGYSGFILGPAVAGIVSGQHGYSVGILIAAGSALACAVTSLVGVQRAKA